MKLTWNQRRALERLVDCGGDATPRNVAEPPRLGGNYLCGSAARTTLMALARKGLAECIPASPIRYRITAAGRNLIEGR